MPPLSTNAGNKNVMADLLCTIMVLCRGTNQDGEPCWAYMCIKPSMAQFFKEAREKGAFDLEEYGTILESGEGEEPPEDIKLRMEREYGMNHNYEENILNTAVKQSTEKIGS